MIWKQASGKPAPNAALVIAQAASAEFGVPVGILLGTVERESNFRLGLVSSAGAVGPCQFKPQYAEDYYRYAGFKFDLDGWASVRGLAAVYGYYAKLGAKRHGFSGDDRWRFALLAHRHGQNSTQARTLDTTGRVSDVEACMERNGVWYSDVAREDKHFDAADVAEKAASWAKSKVGCRYSQAQRDKEGVFDCSSLVARAYAAQGVDWACVGREIPLSCEEVYSDQFELLWPADYAKIGKTFGGESVIAKAKQPGDLQFLCTNRKTGRANKITHVTMVASPTTIVHARGTAYGVRLDDIALYKGKVCAVCRYNPDAPLRQGMRGLRVKALQERLNKLGAKLDVDGVYGSKTAAAVKKYKEG